MNNTTKQKNDIETNNNLISYFDLLLLLRGNNPPQNIILHLCKKIAIYTFDRENGYILAKEGDKDLEEKIKKIISTLKKNKKNKKVLNSQKESIINPRYNIKTFKICNWDTNVFDFYLSDSLLDNQRFDKIIELL